MLLKRDEWSGARGSNKQHKLRKITKSKRLNDTYGITIPLNIADRMEGVYFKSVAVDGVQVVSGTCIVLFSGAKL